MQIQRYSQASYRTSRVVPRPQRHACASTPAPVPHGRLCSLGPQRQIHPPIVRAQAQRNRSPRDESVGEHLAVGLPTGAAPSRNPSTSPVRRNVHASTYRFSDLAATRSMPAHAPGHLTTRDLGANWLILAQIIIWNHPLPRCSDGHGRSTARSRRAGVVRKQSCRPHLQ